MGLSLSHWLYLQAALLGVPRLVGGRRVQVEVGAPVSLPATLPAGTLEERGLFSELVLWKAGRGDGHSHGERGASSQTYGLPTRLRQMLPSSCKAFPCCFLCPRSEEEREEEEEEEGSRAPEEGTVAPEEGTHLLPKLGSGEPQPPGRLTEMEMTSWHTVA